MSKTPDDKRLGKAERDIVALGIATAAIILFVGTGGAVLPDVMRSIWGQGEGPNLFLVNALLLNIALVIFGWRRYKELTNEIAERRVAQKTAQKLAATDSLTDCLNRRSMAEFTAAVCQRGRLTGNPIAFVVIDIDNFKQINDMHGHSKGDAALIEIANRLRAILPNNVKLARPGGDEFAFAMEVEIGDTSRVEELVMRLCESANKPLELGEVSAETTLSAGISTNSPLRGDGPDPIDAETLIHRADVAMYHSKKHGKNRYSLFEPAMEEELRLRNELEVGIRRGLERREFVPYYEQQVDISTGELVGFEMLARWKSPQMGVVSPEIFISIAEDIGVIGALSEQLIELAFQDAREWDPSITLSVNISPVQMRDPWFSQKLLKLLVKHQFPPHRLEIEVTESCLHDNIGMVRSMIASLRNQGVKVSLDDFGTGYSSLSQLRTLKFDRLKIDRSFVSELRDTEANSKIIDAIVSLGNGLDMPITAEGIEDESVLDTLKSLGNFKGQGFHYGQPEDSDQVRARLEKLGKLRVRRSKLSSDEQKADSNVAQDDILAAVEPKSNSTSG